MKIIFFGTPEFAVPVLKKIYSSSHQILAVVTAPDKERGRGRKVSSTPVKEFALENRITSLQPEKLSDTEFITELDKLNADLFVVVAFRILPREVFSMPQYGSFNLHGSILPKYRGAAPIQWALINGEKETGLTTFFLDDKVDTGNIILSEKIEIHDDDNLGSLHDKMSVIGANLVVQTIDAIEKKSYTLKKQDNSLASAAPKITKTICKMDFNNSAENVHNLVRGLSPFPGAFFTHNDKQYKVYKTRVLQDKALKPGEFEETKNEIFVGCSNGSLQVLEIQPEGRKRMTSGEFLRGNSIIDT